MHHALEQSTLCCPAQAKKERQELLIIMIIFSLEGLQNDPFTLQSHRVLFTFCFNLYFLQSIKIQFTDEKTKTQREKLAQGHVASLWQNKG